MRTDADVRRIEAAEQQAKVWSQLADDIEAVTDLVGPGAVEWPLHGVTWQRTDGTDGPVLEIWAQTTDGDKDLVGLLPLGEDDQVHPPVPRRVADPPVPSSSHRPVPGQGRCRRTDGVAWRPA